VGKRYGCLIWRGTPLKTEKGPAPIPGTVYYRHRQPDGLMAVRRRPADLSRPAEVVAHHAGCPEVNCGILDIAWNDGGLEYKAMHQNRWFWWRDGKPLRLSADTDNPRPELETAGSVKGSLVVRGQVVLKFPGKADGRFVSGYAPLRWVGGDERYLLFSYGGYAHVEQRLAAEILGMGRTRGGTYIYDVETRKVHRFIEEQAADIVWQP